jgi:hypothetical protein
MDQHLVSVSSRLHRNSPLFILNYLKNKDILHKPAQNHTLREENQNMVSKMMSVSPFLPAGTQLQSGRMKLTHVINQIPIYALLLSLRS